MMRYRIIHSRILSMVLALLFITVCVKSNGIAELRGESKNTIQHIYKRTPQGELAMFVHLPKGWRPTDDRAVIVLFFGGGFRTGNVGEFIRHARYFASRGMVATRPEYRVKDRHGVMPDRCIEDGKSAIRWLRDNCDKCGIDPNRIAACGHSAGGHIAAATYSAPGFEAEGENVAISAKPNLLVLFNSSLDCTVSCNYVSYLGSRDLAVRLSPNKNLTDSFPPTILFYGSRDPRHLTQGIDFLYAAKQLNCTARLYTAEGESHDFSKSSPWFERTLYLTDQFLTEHGYLEGAPTIKLPEDGIGLDMVSANDITDLNRWGYSPLHRACRLGNYKKTKELLANGSKADATNCWSSTPLHYAVCAGHTRIAKLLCEYGADTNIKDMFGFTPLRHAIPTGLTELAELLLGNGADPDLKNVRGSNALQYAVTHGRQDMAEVLIAGGADINATNTQGVTALHLAVSMANTDMATLLLDNGANVNVKSVQGWTPLFLAKNMNNEQLAGLLRKHGAEE